MDAQSTNASARNEINITEPDPDVLKSRMDDVFRGSVSTNPEDDAESISSIQQYQDVTSEAEASKAWADAKEEAEIKAGIKSCCSRCGTDTHTEGQCTASSSRNATERKISGGQDSKPCKVSIRKNKNFKRFRHDLHQVVVEEKKRMICSMSWRQMTTRTSLRAIWCLFSMTMLRVISLMITI